MPDYASLEALLDQAADDVAADRFSNAREAAEAVVAHAAVPIDVDAAEDAILMRLAAAGRSETGLPLTPMTGYGPDTFPDPTGWA